MATVSYGLKITSAYHIFDETIKIYRKAVEYITDITLLRFDEISVIDTHDGYTKQQLPRSYMESLIHNTKKNPCLPLLNLFHRNSFNRQAKTSHNQIGRNNIIND